MLRFYGDESVAGCRDDGAGDMLLYQWGTYDWGAGESFEFDITRQLIFADDEDDDIVECYRIIVGTIMVLKTPLSVTTLACLIGVESEKIYGMLPNSSGKM